jgi:hypothetical protein
MATTTFDPRQWYGDYEALTGLEQDFLSDHDLCEQTFATKQEAFTAGWLLLSAGRSNTFALFATNIQSWLGTSGCSDTRTLDAGGRGSSIGERRTASRQRPVFGSP